MLQKFKIATEFKIAVKTLPFKNYKNDKNFKFSLFWLKSWLKGKSLPYSTWIGRGFFKMLQISLFGVSINIIGHVFFAFVPKKICVDL
jgi:hypothetical protein